MSVVVADPAPASAPVLSGTARPAHVWSWPRGSIAPYVLGLIGIWLVQLGLLLVLQYLGTGMGLRVWPMGEDRVWLSLMQDNPPAGLPKAFWLVNDRNPLSPWWYMAAEPLIVRAPYGIYVVRKLIDPLCSVAVFLLIDQLGRGRQRLFAFACALLTLLWNFSGFREQILWNFLGALALSVLSIWAYCRFLDSGRRAHPYLSLSLVLYLVAIGTYTLQATSFLAVVILATFRPEPRPRGLKTWLRRLLSAGADAAPYAAVFVVFTLIWYTAARPSSDYYHLSPALIGSQGLLSLQYLVWHYDYPPLLQEIALMWNPAWIVVGGVGSAAISALVLGRIGDGGPGTALARPTRATSGAGPGSTVAYTLAVAAALATATVGLEATSDVWLPGWRAKMIQQVFQPLLYLGLVFGVAALLGRGRAWLGRGVAIGGASVLCAVAFLVGLQYNRDLNQTTALEQRLDAGLKAIVPSPTGPVRFIVKLDGVNWGSDDALSDLYARTYYGSPLVGMRILQPGSPVQELQSFRNIIFGPDDRGVYLVDLAEGPPTWVPYANVRVVRFDGTRVELMKTVGPADLAGYQVGFQRQTPIQQPEAGTTGADLQAPR